ncbi:MAG: AmmeMemoRadiSam system radical SAM enzyme [Candidatus Bathyarchaeia archaeon]
MPREGMLYERLPGGKVKCNLCSRGCVISEGSAGFCRVRVNREGVLESLVYGRLCSIGVDPITKKPLSHFHPGSYVLSIATVGCNFNCLFCDNWVISHERDVSGEETAPEDIVNLAFRESCEGISYTYTEPTVFYEFAYDTSKLAYEKGLFNTFVTNGYMTTQAIRMIAPYLNAATVDFKGGGDPEFYRKIMGVPSVDPIYEGLKEMKRLGIHVEITNLVVTKYGDSLDAIRRLARWVVQNLGPDVPFHLLRFHPEYKLTDVPSTPLQTLEQAWQTAKKEGLHYPYLGNVPGHRYENTYCPGCGITLIERFGFEITRWRLRPNNTCPQCGYAIAVKGGLRRAKPTP